MLIEYQDWPALTKLALERPGEHGQHLEAALQALARAAATPDSATPVDTTADDEDVSPTEEGGVIPGESEEREGGEGESEAEAARRGARRQIAQVLDAIAAREDLSDAMPALTVISALQARVDACGPCNCLVLQGISLSLY